MRPSLHQWAMELASVTAKRATCVRRSVGCVLLNERGHVLSTGYNGVAAGMKHCNEAKTVLSFDPAGPIITPIIDVTTYPNACPGAKSPTGTNYDGCGAIHAEQNALLQCRDVHTIHACYTTTSPCVTCLKLLLNTSCKELYFLEEHVSWKEQSRAMWEVTGRSAQTLTLFNNNL